MSALDIVLMLALALAGVGIINSRGRDLAAWAAGIIAVALLIF